MSKARDELIKPNAISKSHGPYLGPKGGLWADPQHTVHWDPAVHGHKPDEAASKLNRYRQMHAKAVREGNDLSAHMTALHMARLGDDSALKAREAPPVVEHAPAAKPEPNAVTPSQSQAFADTYQKHIIRLNVTTPEAAPALAAKMTEAVANKGALIDTPSMKATSKELGIHHSQGNLAKFVNGQPHRAAGEAAPPRAVKPPKSVPPPKTPTEIVDDMVAANQAALDANLRDTRWTQSLAGKLALKEKRKVLEEESRRLSRDYYVEIDKLAAAAPATAATSDAKPQWTPPVFGEKYAALGPDERYSHKHIATLIRGDVKAAIAAGGLPSDMKLSVTIDHNSIEMAVKSVPFQVLNPVRVRFEAENPTKVPSYWDKQYTPAAQQLLERLEAIHGAYNYDKSDRMTDYYNVNYYGKPKFAWELERDERADILAGKLKPDGVVMPGPNKTEAAPEPPPPPTQRQAVPEPAKPTPAVTSVDDWSKRVHDQIASRGTINASLQAVARGIRDSVKQEPVTVKPSASKQPHEMSLAEYREAVNAGKAGSEKERALASAVRNAAANTPDNLHLDQRRFDMETATNHLTTQLKHGVKVDTEVYRKELERLRGPPPGAKPVVVAPTVTQPVAAGPAADVESAAQSTIGNLSDRLTARRKLHEAMKAANKIVRGSGTDESKIAGVTALGFSDRKAREVVKPPAHLAFVGDGFPAYAIKNNAAEIKRLEERIGTVANESATATREHAFAGGTVIDNAASDRVQIKYDQRPDRATIATLKSRGFKGAPSVGVWQRQRTDNARRDAGSITGIDVPLAERVESPAPVAEKINPRKVRMELAASGQSSLDDGSRISVSTQRLFGEDSVTVELTRPDGSSITKPAKSSSDDDVGEAAISLAKEHYAGKITKAIGAALERWRNK